MLRKAAIALSLANLCFLGVWRKLLPGAGAYYLLQAPPPASAFIFGLLSASALAAVFFIGALSAGRSHRALVHSLARWTFLLVCLILVRGRREILTAFSIRELLGVSSVGINVLTIVVTVAVLFWHRAAARGAAVCLLVSSPFVAVTFGQAAWSLINYEHMFADFTDKPAAPALPVNGTPPRVVWLIFDELDQNLTFVSRPNTVQLPVLDELRREAVYTTNAYPPAGWTAGSIPALLTGRLVSGVRVVSADDLALSFADGGNETADWSRYRDVFRLVREAGLNAAIVGNYHPYCRIIPDLTSCMWRQRRPPPMDRMDLLVHEALKALPGWAHRWAQRRIGPLRRLQRSLSDRLETADREMAISVYVEELAEAKRVVVDPHFQLIFVHMPIPHPPMIYDRFAGRLTTEKGRSYLDNLKLTDDALSEIRLSMESAGVWRTSTVIVSADHGYRTAKWMPRGNTEDGLATMGVEDHRVPFIIKMPGEDVGVEYRHPFNTVVSKELVLAVLEGTLSNAAQVTHWLDKHGSIAELQYDRYGNPMSDP